MVSIPYGAIRIEQWAEEKGILEVSIPYGAIRIIWKKSTIKQIIFVSIPYGAIRILYDR